MKMKLRILSALLIIACCFACRDQSKENQTPLTLLSTEELMERLKSGQMPPMEVMVIRNQEGNSISSDSLNILQQTGEYTVDFYMNPGGEIVEMRVRPSTEADLKVYSRAGSPPGSTDIQTFDIDCSRQKYFLEWVMRRFHKIRKDGVVQNLHAEKANLEMVINIIENCGMPTLEVVDSIHMDAIITIFQHTANQKYRKKYFHQLKTAASRGDLPPGRVAELEDLILVSDGQPQRYGTYVYQDEENETWHLYKLEAPELVDARRAEVGLGGLMEYLAAWEIPFEVAQLQP